MDPASPRHTASLSSRSIKKKKKRLRKKIYSTRKAMSIHNREDKHDERVPEEKKTASTGVGRFFSRIKNEEG